MSVKLEDNWGTAIRDYIKFLSSYHLAPNTIKTYRERLKYIYNHYSANNVDISRLDQIHPVLVFLDYMTGKKASTTTIYLNIGRLKAFCKYLHDEGRVKNPLDITTNMGRKTPVTMSKKEVDKVFDKLSTKEDVRHRIMIELFYGTGIEATELLNLKVEDIDLGKKTMRIKKRNNIERVVPLPPRLLRRYGDVKPPIRYYLENVRPELYNKEGLDNLLLTRTGKVYRRETIWKNVKDVCERAGVEEKGTQRVLRNSFILHMLERGEDIEVIKEAVGLESNFTLRQIFDLLDERRKLEYRESIHKKHRKLLEEETEDDLLSAIISDIEDELLIRQQGEAEEKYNEYLKITIINDKIVLQNKFGLMWHQSGSGYPMNFKEAKVWVNNLNNKEYAGYKDWRLPTREEASSLVEDEKVNNRYINPVFQGKQTRIWTCEEGGNQETTWHVDFSIKRVHLIDSGCYVRPVRSVE